MFPIFFWFVFEGWTCFVFELNHLWFICLSFHYANALSMGVHKMKENKLYQYNQNESFLAIWGSQVWFDNNFPTKRHFIWSGGGREGKRKGRGGLHPLFFLQTYNFRPSDHFFTTLTTGSLPLKMELVALQLKNRTWCLCLGLVFTKFLPQSAEPAVGRAPRGVGINYKT